MVMSFDSHQPMNTAYNNAPTGISTLVMMKSIKPNGVMSLNRSVNPNGLASSSRLNDQTVRKPKRNIAEPSAIAIFERLRPSFSINLQIETSSIESDDDSAAKNTRTKNIAPINAPPGMLPNAVERVTKISPGPCPGSRPWANTIGKIISPANSATNVSPTAIITDDFTISTSSGKYAA